MPTVVFSFRIRLNITPVGRALTQVLVDINRSYMYRWCLVLSLSTVSRGEDMYRGVPELVPDGASSISPGL